MKCSKCGKENPNDAKFCALCGAPLQNLSDNEISNPREINSEVSGSETVPSAPLYLNYCSNVKKINTFKLICQLLTVLIILTLIFIPIYRREYEPTLEEVENWEQFEDVMHDGKLVLNFSLFDDMKQLVELAKAEILEEPAMTLFWILTLNSFAFFEIISAITILGMSAFKMWTLGNELRDTKHTTMLKYNEIKLTGTKQSKPNFFKQNQVYSIIFFAVFDIIISTPYGYMRYMGNFVGFSLWIILLVALLGAYVVLQILTKKEEKDMLIKVTQEQFSA